MPQERLSITKRWRLIIALSLAFLVAIIVQDLIREVLVFDQDIQVFEQELTRDINDDVYNLVENVKTEVDFIVANLASDAALHAQDNLSELSFAIDSIILLHDVGDINELTDDIAQITQQYNTTEESHVYSLFTTSGVELYNGFTNVFSNVDRSSDTDYLSRPYMDQLLTDVASGDTFVTMYQLENDKIEEYVIYAREIEGLDLIVTSSVRMATYSEHRKSVFLSEMGDVYSSAENSVYVISLDGELLYHQTESAIGLTTESNDHPLWASTLQTILDYAESEQSGYLEYEFYSNYVNGVRKTKLAYISTVDEWDIIIGASSDNDIYNAIIDSYRADNARAVLLVKVPAYVVILTLAVAIGMFVKYNVDDAQKLLEEEMTLYQTIADVSSEIFIICDKLGKILFANANGREIIYGQRHPSNPMYFDQIMVEEEGYYIMYGVSKEHFVKYAIKPVEFNRQEADLYVITDVTDKVETERKLEALSMKDELTELYNRRMMVRDYKDLILPHVKSGGSAHLAMIDLDDFKPANDQYGHSFGDVVLQVIARIFLSHGTPSARVYRVGGDEFAMFFRDSSKEEISKILTAMQEDVREYPYGKDISVSFSVGVASIDLAERRRRFTDFYEAADRLLYESKTEGKGTITF